MEVNEGKRNKKIVCTYEAIGTALLMYAVNLSSGSPFAKFGISFTVFALILIAGPVSGAHFNPAVTLGVYISNVHWKEDWGFCLLIMLA
jgi:glycerol uptake facilitator-like aquaporin